MQDVTVIKKNPQGEETWRYPAQVIERQDGAILLEAYFNRDNTDVFGMPLERDDRFVETYYTDRWYNVYEIHAHEDGRLRGWYCNIGCPAEVDGDTISYVDLALDLLVFPDGRQLVLDKDEFEALDIDPDVRRKALAALEELQAIFRERTGT